MVEDYLIVMSTPISIKFPLQRGPRGGFATNDTTLDAVADDLRILLLTNYGERPVQYDFGANLRSVIFECQGDTLRQAVRDLITNAVSKWMPFVNILDLSVEDETVNSTLKSNEIYVKIKFTVGNLDAEKVLVEKIGG